MPKDLFSALSETYARYRPVYPTALFDYIMLFVQSRERAWDCATGNGQAAVQLCRYFKKVDATDISLSQLAHAVEKENIIYSNCPAEHTAFTENSFDLITVAQAYHWLHWKQFAEEATRVAKPGAVIAVWTYGLLNSDDQKLNDLVKYFYGSIVGAYWDKERIYVDEAYATVDFDFAALPGGEFSIQVNWSRAELTGYLESWSAVQKYKIKNQSSPIEVIKEELCRLWDQNEIKSFSFPLYLKMGRIEK